MKLKPVTRARNIRATEEYVTLKNNLLLPPNIIYVILNMISVKKQYVSKRYVKINTIWKNKK